MGRRKKTTDNVANANTSPSRDCDQDKNCDQQSSTTVVNDQNQQQRSSDRIAQRNDRTNQQGFGSNEVNDERYVSDQDEDDRHDNDTEMDGEGQDSDDDQTNYNN